MPCATELAEKIGQTDKPEQVPADAYDKAYGSYKSTLPANKNTTPPHQPTPIKGGK